MLVSGHVILNTSCASFRLAAIALLILQSEEDAFWCLVAVVEAIMPQDYYTKSLVASQVRKLSPVRPLSGHMTLTVQSTVSCDIFHCQMKQQIQRLFTSVVEHSPSAVTP